MSFENVFIAILVFINIIIALMVFLNNPKSWTNKFFSLLTFVFSAYLVVNTMAYVPFSYSMQLFFSRSIMAVATWINLLVFLFLKTFPESVLNLSKKKIVFYFLLTFFLFISCFSDFIFKDIQISQDGVVTPTPGLLMPLFLLHTIFFILIGIVSIIIKFRKSQGLSRKKIIYVLFSFILLFSLILIFNFILTVFFQVGNFVPLLPIYLLLFSVIIGYAIVTKGLLEIRLVVARSVSYLLLLVFITVFYVSFLFSFQSIVLDLEVNAYSLVFSVFLTLLVTFSFSYVNKFFQKITENIFFKKDYDSQNLLEKLGKIASSTLDLNILINKITDLLKNQMKISGLTIILHDEDKINFYKTINLTKNTQSDEEKNNLFMFSNNLNKDKNKKIITYEELEDLSLKNEMEKNNFYLIIPVIINKKQIGNLFLQQKSSGDIYSGEDIKIFSILESQLSIAINNALSFEKIKNFNIELNKQIEQATHDLRKANKRLKEVDQLKDEFVSVASHELRTPMTAIKSYLWLAIHQTTEQISEKMKSYLNISYSSTNRLINLVNDMLTISRIEGGRLVIEKNKIDLNEIVKQTHEELLPIAKNKRINFYIDKKGENLNVDIDSDKMKEVLHNIIGNALKFTSIGGEISLTTELILDKVVIRVKDSGTGIAKNDIDKLFGKFNRLERSYARTKETGTGLGLYISQNIVKMHNGEIKVESEVDKGSTFSIFLPIYQK